MICARTKHRFPLRLLPPAAAALAALTVITGAPTTARAQASPATTVGAVAHASLSPDGSRMVYQKRTADGWRIFTSRADGTEEKALTAGPSDDVEPSWRSDGLLIAFASRRAGNWDLFAVKPDGTGLRALTTTPQDERYPQWSPRPFGLMHSGDIGSHTVPNRPAGAVAPSDLKLLEMLAKDSTDWDMYKSRFQVKPIARYYKLLFVEGSGEKQRIATMRESGTLRQTLSTGMIGAHANPSWERGAQEIAFTVRRGGTDVIYRAAYPNTFDQGTGNKMVLGIDLEEWRKSLQKIGTTDTPGAPIAWAPNGEYVAVASGQSLRLLPRPGSGQAPVVAAAGAGVAPYGFTWLGDARTALVTVSEAGGRTALRRVKVDQPLLDVVNLRDFVELDATDRSYLARNAFVAGGDTSRQMYHVYEQTDYEDLPIVVTTDALFHLNHLVFDYLLRSVETEYQMPAAIALTDHYLKASLAQAKSADERVARSARANAAYFAVAARLAMGGVDTGVRQDAPVSPDDPLAADREALAKKQRAQQAALMERWTAPLKATLATLPADIAKQVDAELALVRAHGGMGESPIFGGSLTGVGDPDAPLMDTRIDYSDFIPRGHYTRSEVLRRYFLVSRWLAAGPFRPTPELTRRALLLVAATDAPTRERWRKVQSVMQTFVGEADDHDFTVYEKIAGEVYGHAPTAADIADEAKIGEFLARAGRLPAPRIAPKSGSSFRFLPLPYTPDADIMQQLVYDRNPPDVGTEQQPRYFALGLDVMAVLGSQRARTILENTSFNSAFSVPGLKETQYANYDTQMAALKARFGAWTESDWSRSLYTRTLYALMPLLDPKPEPNLKFTQSVAWADKNLNAALATWTELKHDTLPKQPAAIEAGDGDMIQEAPLWEQPVGFVEPAPEVYRRLEQLAQAERAVLEEVGYLSAEMKQRLDTYSALLTMISGLETRQRAGERLTATEVEQLRFFGAYLEHLTLVTLEKESGFTDINDMAIVADVASAFSTRQNRLLVLQEGVGRALPIYIAIERNGRRELARGAVFTYYEFTHPAEDRLTDEKWRELLDSPESPKTPEWTRSFMSPPKKKEEE